MMRGARRVATAKEPTEIRPAHSRVVNWAGIGQWCVDVVSRIPVPAPPRCQLDGAEVQSPRPSAPDGPGQSEPADTLIARTIGDRCKGQMREDLQLFDTSAIDQEVAAAAKRLKLPQVGSDGGPPHR